MVLLVCSITSDPSFRERKVHQGQRVCPVLKVPPAHLDQRGGTEPKVNPEIQDLPDHL
jgi:hypothetical protein